jgi:hypothetical protein
VRGGKMAVKLRIKLESCKISKEEGTKLLGKCGFPAEKADEIMQSLPTVITFRSARERSNAFRLLQNGFSAKLT